VEAGIAGLPRYPGRARRGPRGGPMTEGTQSPQAGDELLPLVYDQWGEPGARAGKKRSDGVSGSSSRSRTKE
jgi:hypothetical protein